MTRHNNSILFVALAVYAYRDIWPLATYTESPVDGSEGALLWAKLIVLFTTAAIIPLVFLKVPNPEQMTSILSLIMYFRT